MGCITRSVRDIGLALWWGGTAMGTLAMNPAVEVLDDPEERGKMVDEGWARFQPYAAAGLLAGLLGHFAVRRRGPETACGAYKSIARLSDLLMLSAVVSSMASMALGEYAVHQDFDSYTPADADGAAVDEADHSETSAGLTIASLVQLVSGAGLFLANALLSSNRKS